MGFQTVVLLFLLRSINGCDALIVAVDIRIGDRLGKHVWGGAP